MNSVVGALSLATKTRDSKCYSPSSICEQNLISMTGINELKKIIFVLYYLTVLVYTKTTIHLNVGGQWWIIVKYLCLFDLALFQTVLYQHPKNVCY